ncbi:MAG TPA: hypothetical protein PLD98_07110 [Clostridiales bacterium]|nr:hypothetical protein [Clostridiales bacterium]
MCESCIKFLSPEANAWCDLYCDMPNEDRENQSFDTANKDLVKQKAKEVERNRKRIKEVLLSSLQLQNLMVLTGLGTSLSGGIKGPSMNELWDSIEELKVRRNQILRRDEIAKKINYHGDDIEGFLSQCEAYLQVTRDKDVNNFYIKSKEVILNKCSFDFSKCDLVVHKEFLFKLCRRRQRDSRLKIFTTNYDLCSKLLRVILD